MNNEGRLYRQIHSSFVQQGRVTSQAFRPTPKDENKLSAYDGNRIGAADAYRHYTITLELSSCGVMALLYVECESLSLPVLPDPIPFPEHMVIDFSGLSKSQVEKKAKQLRVRAEERGWIYRAS